MYQIFFYRDQHGKEPVAEYLRELASKADKNSRVNLNKIQDYMGILSEYGTRAGEPYVKHISGDLWELRPLSNRIFFAAWHNGSFILLHHFIKKSKKTPKKEIEQAQRELADLVKREKE